jgi:adenylate kinase family enzyme
VSRKIAVKGASGSGKTTFAAELARRLGVPHVELDALHHGPNWSAPTAAEFRARVRHAIDVNTNGWVIDGNYESKLDDLVAEAADSIVWLDLPLWTLLARLWQRTSKRITQREELWNGNRESWRTALWGWDALFVWTIRAYFRHRRSWPQRLANDPRWVRLRTPAEARAWLERQSRSPGTW